MTASHRWTYSIGEAGRNRVNVFEHPKTGVLYVEYRERDPRTNTLTRRRMSMGHRDRRRATRQAREIAAALASGDVVSTTDPTLATLFDIYGREVTATKGRSKQAHDRRASAMFLRLFDRQRTASSLTRRDWDHFVTERRAGRIGPDPTTRRPVKNRQIAYDLLYLRSVLRWAVNARLLEQHPLVGCPLPRERDPKRPLMDPDTYAALLAVAGEVDPRFRAALVLAHETGHRQQAICQLRWSDIDLGKAEITWRGATDKSGTTHRTPLTPEALEALAILRRTQAVIGDGWLFPAPRNPDKPCSRDRMATWFRRAVTLAGVDVAPGTGFHSLRRQFATELKDVPLPDLCALGGWTDPKTILTCYQVADPVTMRAALAARRPLGEPPPAPLGRGHTRGHTPKDIHLGTGG